jgi:hypothetical protein
MDEILPNALMIGVDYDLFWTLSPKSLKPFIKAFHLRQDYERFQAWQIGAYVQQAIGASLSKDAKYPKPPEIGVTEKIMSKGKDELEKSNQQLIRDKFLAQVNLINKKFAKEDKNEK